MAGLAEQVLDHFRDRFIAEVDANAIVLELEHCGIISNGDQTEVRHETNATQQNQLLHACLKKKCTVEALMIVCDIITKVKGNPKLKSLGEDMKTELEKVSESKVKEREKAMADERRLALEPVEKVRNSKELEEYLKKPTFAERCIETKITRSGWYRWEYVHTAEAVDVATGIRAEAKNYKSKDGAKEHARANLKAILLERGVIRKD